MMVECLKHDGTLLSSCDLLKICVKMGVASWSAQVFRQAGDRLSGPGAFLRLFFLKIFSYLQCRCGGDVGCRRCEWYFSNLQ